MAGKSDYFENALLQYIFHGVVAAGMEGVFGTPGSPLTQFHLSLHSADPGDAAVTGQQTNELTYGGYARIAVNRNSAAWGITGNQVSPLQIVEFPECTSGSQTATHVGIGTAATGEGKLLYSGAITPAIAISVSIVPRLKTTSKLTED